MEPSAEKTLSQENPGSGLKVRSSEVSGHGAPQWCVEAADSAVRPEEIHVEAIHIQGRTKARGREVQNESTERQRKIMTVTGTPANSSVLSPHASPCVPWTMSPHQGSALALVSSSSALTSGASSPLGPCNVWFPSLHQRLPLGYTNVSARPSVPLPQLPGYPGLREVTQAISRAWQSSVKLC